MFDEEKLWLCLKSEESPSVHVAFPEPTALTQEELEFIHRFDAPTLELFCTHFREVSLVPNACNPFLNFQATPVTTDYLWGCGETLAGGLGIFHDFNGDQMILSIDGKIWKLAHELAFETPEEIKLGFEDFRSFILSFARVIQGCERGWDDFKFY